MRNIESARTSSRMMSTPSELQSPDATIRALRTGWCCWGALALFAVVTTWPNEPSSVPGIYAGAALRWCFGENLYGGDGTGFIYLPHAAILFIPFVWLPLSLGAALWQMTNVAVFGWGVRRATGLLGSHNDRYFLPVSLLTIPLAWSAARHGQMTLAMGGLLLAAVVALAQRRWTLAAAQVCLAVAVKPLAIVLVLLVGALYRPTRRRLACGALILFVAPFLFQRPEYVQDQYAGALSMLHTAADLGVRTEWPQLFGMLAALGLDLSSSVQLALRLLFAVLTLLVAWLAVRRLHPHRAALSLFALTALYILLFNPRTERNTYALLAPAMALGAVNLLCVERHRLAGYVHLGLMVCFLSSYQIGALIPGGPLIVKPLLTVVFGGLQLGQMVHWLRRAADRKARAREANRTSAAQSPRPQPHTSGQRSARDLVSGG